MCCFLPMFVPSQPSAAATPPPHTHRPSSMTFKNRAVNTDQKNAIVRPQTKLSQMQKIGVLLPSKGNNKKLFSPEVSSSVQHAWPLAHRHCGARAHRRCPTAFPVGSAAALPFWERSKG